MAMDQDQLAVWLEGKMAELTAPMLEHVDRQCQSLVQQVQEQIEEFRQEIVAGFGQNNLAEIWKERSEAAFDQMITSEFKRITTAKVQKKATKVADNETQD